MAIVNINADMNQDTAVNIDDAGAIAGTHLFQFFTDEKNVFNIASQSISGDSVDAVTVTPDTSYEFTITSEQAKLLNGSASTYKHYLLDGQGGRELKNEGTVTVTDLSPETIATLVPFINGSRLVTLPANAAAFSAKADNDTIYANPSNLVQTVITLPDANAMPGKRFEIKNAGQGTVRINTPIGDQLINLDTTGDTVQIKAKGADENDWECFYG